MLRRLALMLMDMTMTDLPQQNHGQSTCCWSSRWIAIAMSWIVVGQQELDRNVSSFYSFLVLSKLGHASAFKKLMISGLNASWYRPSWWSMFKLVRLPCLVGHWKIEEIRGSMGSLVVKDPPHIPRASDLGLHHYLTQWAPLCLTPWLD